MDDYVRRGLEQAQAVVNDTATVKPAVTAYTRREIAPAAQAAYRAIEPLVRAITASGPNASGAGHEGRRLFDQWDNLRSLPRDVGDQLVRSLSGEDSKVPAEQATAQTLSDLAGLRTRLQHLSWQKPAQLATAMEKLSDLEAALQWEAIASKVVT